MLAFNISCTHIVYEKDLFHPQKSSILSDSILRKNISISINDSISIRGWHLQRSDYTKTIIYFYGNGERLSYNLFYLFRFAEYFKVNILAFDYQGYGMSDGNPTFPNLLNDANKIYNYAVDSLCINEENIVTCGYSIGTIPALHIATEKVVAGLILIAPPTSAADIIKNFKNLLPWYIRWAVSIKPDTVILKHRPQPVDMISKYSAPLLVVAGENDKIIPASFAKIMYDKAKSNNKHWCLIPNAGHNYLNNIKSPFSDSLQIFINLYGK